jgi:tRNA pseudouridine(55) synthase/ribosome-binding factor A
MPREFSRSLRVAEQLQRELAVLIRDEVKDPRLGMVSISGVEVSRDMAHAKIFVSVLGEGQVAKESLEVLTRAASFLRRELGRRMLLRTVPQLRFIHDRSLEEGARMSALIDEGRRYQETGPPGFLNVFSKVVGMARRRTHGRPVNGILLLDKPMGATSNAALQQVKRLFQAQKAGHTGSLDPLATGVLPICLGEATKASAFLLDADKHYRVVCKLGETTSTQDAEGEVLETRPVGDYDLAELEAVLDRFRGPQEQVPPMFSAVKHEGQRLYKLARQGIEVERKARSIVIHELSLLSWESPYLEIEVHCSKGTYVRTLAEDIGEAWAVAPMSRPAPYRGRALRRR